MKITEAAFQQQVLDLAALGGWRVAHFRPAQTARGWRTAVAADGAGFPDLVLVRGPELIFAELKTEKGRLRAEQEAWLSDLQAVASGLRAAGEPAPPAVVDVYVWRPSDFDEINARLRRAPGPREAA